MQLPKIANWNFQKKKKRIHLVYYLFIRLFLLIYLCIKNFNTFIVSFSFAENVFVYRCIMLSEKFRKLLINIYILK